MSVTTSDLIERLEHVEENCRDEYLAELVHRAADRLAKLEDQESEHSQLLGLADTVSYILTGGDRAWEQIGIPELGRILREKWKELSE